MKLDIGRQKLGRKSDEFESRICVLLKHSNCHERQTAMAGKNDRQKRKKVADKSRKHRASHRQVETVLVNTICHFRATFSSIILNL